MAEPTTKSAFEIGQEFRLGLAAPLPDKPDNIVTAMARVVSREWGGNNLRQLGMKPMWFYRLQIEGYNSAVEFSESDLKERIRS